MTDDEMAAPLAPEHPAEAEEPVAVEFHKPKPVHNWREFLSEIGVVVLGILIALAGEQLIEWLHWQHKTADAREALTQEIASDDLNRINRIVLAPCLQAQLDRIEAVVLAPGDRLRPIPAETSIIGPVVYLHPSRSWSTEVWNSVTAEQVGSHLPEELRLSFGSYYDEIAMMRSLNQAEDSAGAALLALSKPLPLDASVRAHFVELIEGERERLGLMAFIAQQQLDSERRIVPNRPDPRRDREWSASFGPDSTAGWCRAHHLPLAPVPKL